MQLLRMLLRLQLMQRRLLRLRLLRLRLLLLLLLCCQQGKCCAHTRARGGGRGGGSVGRAVKSSPIIGICGVQFCTCPRPGSPKSWWQTHRFITGKSTRGKREGQAAAGASLRGPGLREGAGGASVVERFSTHRSDR